ncbi:MAG: type II secretion system inner membrane protein GspF [Deltaproteobacteria bacterium]|nr:type II secretion system inner membrane protein GspF [Deltaproteobacteria bacterium]
MPVYEYIAYDRRGKNKKGIIDADSAVAARQKLRGSEIFPIELKETSVKRKEAPSGRISGLSLRRIRSRELSAMTRQLSTLLGAGISLVASLEALIIQVTNPHLKKVLAQIKESVNEGNSLAASLSQHSRLFSQVYINMVRAGEASGSLDLVLERLADFSEHQDALRGRFMAAMIYPVIMTLMGIFALTILVTFVVPKFVHVFHEMEKALPLPTIIVIGASNFITSFWWLILGTLIIAVIGISRFKKTPKGQRLWDQTKLQTPLFGPINIKMAMARFGRTLGSLLQSGVPVLSALQIVHNIVNNILIADDIDKAVEEIQAGKALAVPLSKSHWVPPLVVQMITVGEQSGDLEKMLNKIADVYEREVESQITAMTSLLEPVMILVMAVMVGFIAISILLPILEMSQIVR